MRTASVKRKTAETDIGLSLSLDGKGTAKLDTGCGFLEHMLTLFAKHGGFDLAVSCKGDTNVDYHHTTEDIGICLGEAFAQALGDKRGINRYGSFLLPMDEALVLVALDICGRAHLSYDVTLAANKVGDFDTELAEEFLLALTRSMGLTLHVRQLTGRNTHHILEAVFKGLARALGQAVAVDAARRDEIPSTKGLL